MQVSKASTDGAPNQATNQVKQALNQVIQYIHMQKQIAVCM